MANDLPLFDIVWEPPASKLSQYGERDHPNGKVHSSGVSNRKALPLSLFGEEDEGEDESENGDVVESKVEKEDEDEFGDFESVPSQPVGTEKSSNGWASIPPIGTENSSNSWISRTPIETTSNGLVSTTPLGTEKSSNGWASTTPLGTEKSSNGWASTTPLGTENSSNGWASTTPLGTEKSSNGWASTTPLGTEKSSNGWASTTPLGTEKCSNGWASTTPLGTEKNSNGWASTTPLGTEKSSNGWPSTTPTSQLMLAMHGIHRYNHSSKVDDFSFPPLSNGFASSQEAVPPSASHDQGPGTENGNSGVDDSDSDIWGDFVQPSVSASSWYLDTSKITSSLLDTPSVPLPVDKDPIKTASPDIDMLDLISMSDDVPDGYASTQVKEDSSNGDLMSGPVLNDTKEGEDLLALWDTNLDSQPVEVSGPTDIPENGSLGDFINNGPVDTQPIENDKDKPLPLSLFEETGDTEGSLGYYAPKTESDLGSSYSRSVSLPGIAGVNFSDFISSLYEESDGMSATGSKLHRRRHSSNIFSMRSTRLNEWPSGEPVEADSEVDVDEGIKSGMEYLLDTSLSNGRKSAAGDDLIDISGLDWEVNEVGTALNDLDVNETSYLSTLPGTASKLEAESVDPQGNVASPMIHIQLQYARAWSSLACACASELGNGLDIWQEATVSGSCTQLVSTKQGQNFFAAIAQIYKVYLLLSATVELYSSWLQGAEEQGKATMLPMEQCKEAWTGLTSAVELLGTSILEDLGRLEDALHSIVGSAVQVDASQKLSESHCGLSLLPLQSVSDVPSVKWDEQFYFLPIANLWANRVSSDPPSECLDV